MSKSKGDFLTLSLLEEKEYSPLAYRFFCLQSHYSKPLEFSFETLDNTKTAYGKLIKRVCNLTNEGSYDEAAAVPFLQKFSAALCKDLNTAKALSVVYDVLKSNVSGKTKRTLLAQFDRVLSLGLAERGEEASAPDEELSRLVESKIAERSTARAQQDFNRADAIRDELLSLGVTLIDGRDSTTWSVVPKH